MSTVSESRQARSSSRLRRIWALMRKESLELVRDPSSIALGIVMPAMLVLLFGYGLSLDLKNVPVAVVMEDASPDARELAAGFQLSPYFNARLTTSLPYARQLMLERKVKSPREKLRRYAGIYAEVLRDGRMCLCGMLAAEYVTLPKAMQQELRHFFDENERWLGAVLEQGRRAGELEFSGAPREVARLLVSSLEGAMMLARSHGDVRRFRAVAERLIAALAA